VAPPGAPLCGISKSKKRKLRLVNSAIRRSAADTRNLTQIFAGAPAPLQWQPEICDQVAFVLAEISGRLTSIESKLTAHCCKYMDPGSNALILTAHTGVPADVLRSQCVAVRTLQRWWRNRRLQSDAHSESASSTVAGCGSTGASAAEGSLLAAVACESTDALAAESALSIGSACGSADASVGAGTSSVVAGGGASAVAGVSSAVAACESRVVLAAAGALPAGGSTGASGAAGDSSAMTAFSSTDVSAAAESVDVSASVGVFATVAGRDSPDASATTDFSSAAVACVSTDVSAAADALAVVAACGFTDASAGAGASSVMAAFGSSDASVAAAASSTEAAPGPTDDDDDPELAEAIALSLHSCQGQTVPECIRFRILEPAAPIDETMTWCCTCGTVIRGHVVHHGGQTFHFGCRPIS